MTASQQDPLATEIEAAVRATDGVSGLFRAGSPAANVLEAGARLVGIRDGSAPLVRLEQTADAVRVEIAVGVEARVGAVETIQRVEAAVRDAVAARHPSAVDIRITVVHVDETVRGEG